MRRSIIRDAVLSLAAATALAAAVPVAAQAATVARPTVKPAGVAGSTVGAPSQGCVAPTYPTTDAAVLTPRQELLPGQSVSNRVGNVSLVMQTDGNLVIYLVSPIGVRGPALWSSNTSGNPGAYVYMQDDGNFVIYNRYGGPSVGGAIWSTNTSGHPSSTASLRGNGDFTVDSSSGTQLFRSGTAQGPVAICLPSTPDIPVSLPVGGWIQSRTAWLLVQSDGNLVLYRRADGLALWSSGTFGSGRVHLVMQSDGNLVLYRRADGLALWSSGTFGSGRVHLVMQSDGNLVLYRTEANGDQLNAVWSSNTSGNSGAYALLQDDTNFVVYGPNGGPTIGGALWSTNTSGRG